MPTVDWSQWPNLTPEQRRELSQAYRDIIREEQAVAATPEAQRRLDYALTHGRVMPRDHDREP